MTKHLKYKKRAVAIRRVRRQVATTTARCAPAEVAVTAQGVPVPFPPMTNADGYAGGGGNVLAFSGGYFQAVSYGTPGMTYPGTPGLPGTPGTP
ncbi:MAG: hypothetical protein V4610_22890, partial [Pseudomonadota bacterium]